MAQHLNEGAIPFILLDRYCTELGCDVDQAKKEHRELKELLDKAKQKLREWNGREFQSIRLEDLKKEYEAEKPASSKKKTIKLEHEIDLVHDCY
ncbi:hypothetical protein Moror_4722 [Moniliophthora roreri MCA 2997]|uniref:Uncharacterized protein n=1 Tax=Moniliophthora roreri (strain MCA 2997) TaxID=1381753 RepID=V2XI74_MONRO|nr:hypothetical protein Moror_4722 [Moniliophthora roreri MCA 2997]